MSIKILIKIFNLFVGSLCGLVAAISALLITAATVYPGGLSNFIANTGAEYSVIAGLLVGIVFSGTICVTVSMATTTVKTSTDVDDEWMKTISISNPLNPWKRIYKDELKDFGPDIEITHKEMATIFRPAKRTAYIGGTIGFILFMFVLPGTLLSFDTLSYDNFLGWLRFNHVWCLLGGIFAIFAPPIEECLQIYRQYKLNRESGTKSSNFKLN